MKLLLLIIVANLTACSFDYKVVRNDDTKIVDQVFTDENSAVRYVETYKEHHDYKIVKSLQSSIAW